MPTRAAIEQAALEIGAAPVTAGGGVSLAVACPAKITLGGLPARALSATDFGVICQALDACGEAGVHATEMHRIMAFCLTRTDEEAYWTLAQDPAAVRKAAFAWAGLLTVPQFAAIVADLGPHVDAFLQAAALFGEPDEKEAQKKRTGWRSSWLMQWVRSVCLGTKPRGNAR